MSSMLLVPLSLGLLGAHVASPTFLPLHEGEGDEHFADWPRYLGPDGTGKTTLSGVDFDWGEEGPQVLWRVDVGPGYGGAAVHGGEVVLLDREVGQADVLRVLELETGELAWDAFYEAPGRLNFPGSRTVPAVTDEHIYTCGGFGRVVCFDREAREELWSVHLADDYGGNLPGYGWSCSPVLIGDLVVVTALGNDVGLVAFDRFTGEEAWVTGPVGTTHSTPVVMDLLGETQLVFVSSWRDEGTLDDTGTVTISSFDPEDGSLLWETRTDGSRYPIPGPVQVDHDRFFVTGGYRGGSSLHRISRRDGEYAFERLFRIERGAQVHTAIPHEEHLYLLVNENWNEPRNLRPEGGLLCLGLDGKERWRTGDSPYFGRGNVLLAGEHLLIQDGFDGKLRVVRATPEAYQLVAEANVFGIEDRRDHQMWAPMALAGRRLLLRSQDELLCLEL